MYVIYVCRGDVMSRTPARIFMGDPEQIGLTHAYCAETCTSWEDFSSRVSKKDFKEKDFQTLLLFIDSGKQERGHTHQIQPSYLEPPWAEATRS